MINTDKLLKYIIENSTNKAIGKAKRLHKEDRILSYMSEEQYFSAKIKGEAATYEVEIEQESSNSFYLSCSCPYDWGGYCKHIGAVAYFLEELDPDENDTESIEVDLQEENSRRTEIRAKVEIKKEEKRRKGAALCIDSINEADFQRKYFYRWDEYFRYRIEGSFSKHQMTFKLVPDFYFGKNSATATVKLYYKDEHYYINCDCGRTAGKAICEHESKSLNQLSKHTPEFLTFLRKGALEIGKDFMQRKAIPKKYATSKNIEMYFSDHYSLELKFKNELEHLVGDQFLIKSHLNTPGQQNELEKMKRKLGTNQENGMAFGILLEAASRKNVLPCVLAGKKAKRSNSFVSQIRKASFLSIPSGWNEKQREVLRICEPYHKLDTIRSDFDLEENIQLLQNLWSYLDQDTILYYSPYRTSIHGKLSRNGWELLQIQKKNPEIKFHVFKEKGLYHMQMSIYLEEEELNLANLKHLHGPLLSYGEQCILLKNNAQVKMMEEFETYQKISFTEKSKAIFCDQILSNLIKHFPVQCDFIKTRKVDEISFELLIDELDDQLLFVPYVIYQKNYRVALLQKSPQLLVGEVMYQREQQKEKLFRELLTEIVPHFNRDNEVGFTLSIEEMLSDNWFFTFFEKMRENQVTVKGIEKLKKFRFSSHKAQIDYQVHSNQDWFEVNVSVAFGDETISIKDLKNFIRSGKKYIELSDGKLGILPEEWLKQFQGLLREAKVKEDQLQISKLKFNILDELLKQIDSREVQEELMEKRKRIRNFKKINQQVVPQQVKASLRDYQLSGLNWLHFLDEMKWGGILADDMGLGKTLQILSFLQDQKNRKKGTSLVIVPATLLFNWENEMNKFCPSLKALIHYSTGRKRTNRHFDQYDLIISTYGLLVKDVEIFKEFQFNYVILDESQAIKNVSAQRYKASLLLKAKNRLALTGTPIENNTFDLFAQMNFLNPGFLGSAAAFKKDYALLIDKDRDEKAASRLQKMIHPFLLRRTKEEVAKELPPKTEDVIYCTMDQEQRKVYDAYRNKYRDYLLGKVEEEGMEKSKIYILEGLTKLRQICDSPALIGESEESVKIKELADLIQEKTAGHKIVIFSQFVSMLNLIRQRLEQDKIVYEYLDGQCSQKRRKESVEHFQTDKDCRVFLISLKAGGTGLNLTAADYVYLVDPWWNPAVENQAIDRCYRIGQDKKVFAYRMICKDSIEEKILMHQKRKKEVADDLIHSEQNFMKELSADDLMELFS